MAKVRLRATSRAMRSISGLREVEPVFSLFDAEFILDGLSAAKGIKV